MKTGMEKFMNLAEFKRKLMTDPHSRDAEFLAACKKDEEFARLAADSAAFEDKLQRALQVPVSEKLAEEILKRQRLETSSSRRRMPVFLAAATALMLAVGVSVFVMFDSDTSGHHDLAEYLAWHWELDGPSAMTTSHHQPSDAEQIQRVFGELGVHVDHHLMDSIRLAKFCPTPDGAGAHVILETADGPVTMFYMPRSQAPDAPRLVELPDGMEGWLINLERGSMALIAETNRDTRELADEIQRKLSFTPGMNL
jgi:hypothetical protein